MRRNTRVLFLLFLLLVPLLGAGFAFCQKTSNNHATTTIERQPDSGGLILQKNTDITSTDGKIIGTGLPSNATLICNKTGGPIPKNSSASLEVSVPIPWSVVFSNITIINIIRDTDIVIIEDNSTGDRIDIGDKTFGMQFNVSASTKITNFSMYVQDIDRLEDITVQVYNATLQASQPAPDSELYSEYYSESGGDIPYEDHISKWYNFTFSSPVELNPSNTYGNAFFVVLTSTLGGGPAGFNWGYETDSGEVDDGAAYQYLSSTWVLKDWDFTLKVGLINVSKSPSEIGLKINGTLVTDKNYNDGEWLSTSVYNNHSGSITFVFSANESATFLVEWSMTHELTSNYGVYTYFTGYDTDPIIFWNATYGASFLAGSLNNQLIFEIPAWKSIINVWKNQTLHADWNSSLLGSSRQVHINDAANASWTIQCNDTNYVESVYIKRSGILVSEVNGTDTIEVFSNFTNILTSGDANLTVFPLEAYYNDTVGEAITNNRSIKFTPEWRLNDTALSSYPAARLQVIWFNGTAAGINTTILTVNYIPTNITYKSHTSNVQSGESIYAYVNFSNVYTGEGLIGANLLIKNSTSNTIWPAPFQISNDYLNGTYQIAISTLGLTSGSYLLSINLSKPLHQSSEYANLSFTIGVVGGASNISITAPNCIGLDSLNKSYAITNPAPYHNSSVKVRIYYFSNLTLEALSSGIITATWVGGGPAVGWVPAFFGYYNITIDVTGFQAGTNHTLRVSIQQAGYDPATLYIIVPTRKLPTSIQSLEPNYAGYLQDTLVISAIFQDTHHDESIPSVYQLGGNCTIQIGSFYDNMSLLIPLVGIYQYVLDLSLLGVEEGQTYTITLYAFSSEHELAMVNVSLYIIPRNAVTLTCLTIPAYFFAGMQFKVYAELTYVNGTPISDAILNTRFRFQPGPFETTPVNLITNSSGIAEIIGDTNPSMDSIQIIIEYSGSTGNQNTTLTSSSIPIIILNSSLILSPLPGDILVGEDLEVTATLRINGTPAADQIVTFTFTDGTNLITEKVAETNSDGKATVTLNVPSGIGEIKVTASYEGPISYIKNSTSITAELEVITILTLIARYSPYWGSAVVGVVIGAAFYQFKYRRPKRRRELKRLEEIASKFDDVHNMVYIMLIFQETGVPLLEYPVSTAEINPVLIAGFLNAISSFKEGIIKTEKPAEDRGWELAYENLEIFWITGELTNYALLSKKKISTYTRKNISNFLKEFEDTYRKELTQFLGDIKIFQPNANNMIKKHLEVDLVLPQRVYISNLDQIPKMSKTKSALIALGMGFEEDQGHFHLAKLLSTAVSAQLESKLKLVGDIHELWQLGIFQPITTDTSKSKNKKKEETKLNSKY
ncbi:MAG: hypothetical protein HWN65_07350 [Candidatus Helarchaeota archaeon]|nr:hypothetical protein [Candidatus Helarchaeota archaeon]